MCHTFVVPPKEGNTMTISSPWAQRVRIILALLVLVPTFSLLTSHAEAEAASWKTFASGWATGASPSVWLGGETRANPKSVRLQVTNHAGKAREVDVFWSRACDLKNGSYSYASGDYVKKVGKGKTHTKTIAVPKNAITCDVSAWVDVWSHNEPGVRGKLTVKAQAS